MIQQRPTSVTVVYLDAARDYAEAEVTECIDTPSMIPYSESVGVRVECEGCTDEGAARRYARFLLMNPAVVVEYEPPV